MYTFLFCKNTGDIGADPFFVKHRPVAPVRWHPESWCTGLDNFTGEKDWVRRSQLNSRYSREGGLFNTK
jgi:hypothetical protein